MSAVPVPSDQTAQRPGPWVDLALTLPIFLVYHFGVVFLNVRNATDWVTTNLLTLAEGSRPMYLLITAAIGVVFAGMFAWLGRGQAFRTGKFVQVLLEGTIYAMVMRLAGAWSAGLFLGPVARESMLSGVITSFGAGFYEELAFRVVLFGLGGQLVLWTMLREPFRPLTGTSSPLSARAFFVLAAWACVCALLFSAVHYVGALRDTFAISSFVFRATLGLVLTAIYAFRGFSTAVWAHAIYDVWIVIF